jgi:hypothetical protein
MPVENVTKMKAEVSIRVENLTKADKTIPTRKQTIPVTCVAVSDSPNSSTSGVTWGDK